jgi:biotin carboxylase
MDLENLEFPLIVKPVSMSGGKGTTIVSNAEELKIALSYADEYKQEILLEEVIKGDIFSYSVFIHNKKVLYEFSAKEYTYVNKYVISSAHPHQFDSKVLERLRNDVEIMAEELSLVDGMFHLQVMIEDNKPYIIDVTRRIAGDLYPDLIEKCDNVQYLKAVVQGYTGTQISTHFFSKSTNQKFIIRQCLLPKTNGKFIQTYVDSTIKEKVIDRLDLMSPDDVVDDYLTTLIGVVFIQLDNYDKKIIQNLTNLIYPEIIENDS